MRLIDADALKENNCELWERDFNHPRYEDTLGDIIADAPTIDAVEVVRCKDCYHAEDDITHMYCVYFGHKVYEDDYCSNAVERREDGEA